MDCCTDRRCHQWLAPQWQKTVDVCEESLEDILFSNIFFFSLFQISFPSGVSNQIPHSLTFSLTPVQVAKLWFWLCRIFFSDTNLDCLRAKKLKSQFCEVGNCCFCSGVEGGVQLLPRRLVRERKRGQSCGGSSLAGWLAG